MEDIFDMPCKRPSIILYFIIILWIGPLSIPAQGQDLDHAITDTLALNLDLFAEDNPASITLKFDIKEFLKEKNENKYVDAELLYYFNDSLNMQKGVRIRARGNNRREVCNFPPLYIDIKKSMLNSKSLSGTEKIKFVTHCIRSKNNENVLREYLIYKMYNVVSPYSFRVRLTKVKYIDTGRKNKEYISWGFFIEPEEMLAERIDAVPLKVDYIGYRHTDPWITDIMSMFQFIIGNADYSILSRQNIKLLKSNTDVNLPPVPVPYDFDYSGFVNAAYAIPGDNLGISSVRERYFLGPCRTEEQFGDIFNYFFELKDELYTLIESLQYMGERERKTLISYLDEFYLKARQKKYIKINLLSTCRDIN